MARKLNQNTCLYAKNIVTLYPQKTKNNNEAKPSKSYHSLLATKSLKI